jgi:hypothetical protein
MYSVSMLQPDQLTREHQMQFSLKSEYLVWLLMWRESDPALQDIGAMRPGDHPSVHDCIHTEPTSLSSGRPIVESESSAVHSSIQDPEAGYGHVPKTSLQRVVDKG